MTLTIHVNETPRIYNAYAQMKCVCFTLGGLTTIHTWLSSADIDTYTFSLIFKFYSSPASIR